MNEEDRQNQIKLSWSRFILWTTRYRQFRRNYIL